MRNAILICMILVLCGCSRPKFVESGKHDQFNFNKKECEKDGDVSYNLNGAFVFQKCVNGKLVENTEARKKWEDEQVAAVKEAERIEKHRKKLYWALRTRVLTNEEMKEVESLNDQLVCASANTTIWINGWGNSNYSGNSNYYYPPQPAQPDSTVECSKILNDALLQQFRLRAVWP